MSKKEQVKEEVQKQSFFFPNEGVTVLAENLEEAQAIIAKLNAKIA